VSITGSIGSGTVSLDMVDSVASLDESVRTLGDAINHMKIVDEEVRFPCDPVVNERMKLLQK
jgi:hypothetical protein